MLCLESGFSTESWFFYIDSGNDLNFAYKSTPTHGAVSKGYLRDNSDVTAIDFTGQHRSITNKNIDNSSVGLIVSCTGKYLNLDNSINPKISESLPEVKISNKNNDKKVFGVLSDKEDSENSRKYNNGCWGSIYEKENTNEERIFINSLGEGAVWVCNINGNLENGDYISSCTVNGYGQLQNDDLLHNYTVAKITCDCNFSLTKIVKQKLKTIKVMVDEVREKISDDEEDSTETVQVEKQEIVYDDNGDVQYEDDLDENGQQQMVYEYETRFLDATGNQLDESDYNTRKTNGEDVYIACFVGCTYHCG